MPPKPGREAVQVPSPNGLLCSATGKDGLCRQAELKQAARAMTVCIKSCLAALTC